MAILPAELPADRARGRASPKEVRPVRRVRSDVGAHVATQEMRGSARLVTLNPNVSHIDQSQRFCAHSYSDSEIDLRMPREIGGYLGLSLETVSGLFSWLQAHGLIAVRQKHVMLHCINRLQTIAGRDAVARQFN